MTSRKNSNGGSEVNVVDIKVNMKSNATSKSYAQSAEIVVHEDESDGGGADTNDCSDSSSSSSEEDEEDDDNDEGEEENDDEGNDVDIEEGEIKNLKKEETTLNSGDEKEEAVKGPIHSSPCSSPPLFSLLKNPIFIWIPAEWSISTIR